MIPSIVEEVRNFMKLTKLLYETWDNRPFFSYIREKFIKFSQFFFPIDKFRETIEKINQNVELNTENIE